ncbi:hypothetical protein EDD16DRAFT_1106278 [Pisolithus croceorrhizus]|nr:hypothetical protein EDD16DRAFT_1106278 [Pisolithus croceorrhizus]
MEIIKRRGARRRRKCRRGWRDEDARFDDQSVEGEDSEGETREKKKDRTSSRKLKRPDGTDVGDDDDESDCCYCRGQSLNVARAFRPHMPHDREPAGRDEGLLRRDNAPLATLHSTAFPQCRRTVRAIACYGPFCHCSYLFSLWEHTKGSGAFQNRCFVCGRRAWHHRDGYSPLVFC